MKNKLDSFYKIYLWDYSKKNLHKNPTEKGFVIPLVLGFGLLMILIAVTMITRSNDDKINSAIQSSTAQALGNAEVGVAQFQFLINKYRAIATYDDCVATRVNGVCPDPSTVASWKNATLITNIDVDACIGNPDDKPSTKISDIATTTNWTDNETGGLDKGQYKLISYKYTPAPGVPAHEAPGTGVLIVEGRANQSGTGGSATKGINTGTTRLRIEIPVVKNELRGTLAGLWITADGATPDMGNDRINGSIVVEDCNMPTGSGAPTTANLVDPATQKVEANPAPMPDTPDLPTANLYILDNPFTTLPRGGDAIGADGRYHYLVKHLVTSGNTEILITPGNKVVFYLQGNLDIGGTPNYNPNTNATNLQIYGNTYLRGANDAVIEGQTKYGCFAGGTVSGSTASIPNNQKDQQCPTRLLLVNGTGLVKAVIHAPDAVGGVAGGGDTEGNFKGSIWIKNWDSLSGSSKVKIDAEGELKDVLSAVEGMVLKPNLSSTTMWQRKEVE